jgi:cysteine desulfurase
VYARVKVPAIIYLDHNATTPVLREVFEAMWPGFCEEWDDPSSAYKFGSTRMPQLNSEDTKTRRLEDKAMPAISPKSEAFTWQVIPNPPPTLAVS